MTKSPAVILVTAKGCGGCETYKRPPHGSSSQSSSPREKIAGSELDLTLSELDKLVTDKKLSMYYWADLDYIGQTMDEHFGNKMAARKKVHPELNNWIGFFPQVMIFDGNTWYNKSGNLKGSVMGGQWIERGEKKMMNPGADNFEQTDRTQLRHFDVINWVKTNIPKYSSSSSSSNTSNNTEASSSISPRITSQNTRRSNNRNVNTHNSNNMNKKQASTAGYSITVSEMSSSEEEY